MLELDGHWCRCCCSARDKVAEVLDNGNIAQGAMWSGLPLSKWSNTVPVFDIAVFRQ